MDQDDEQVRALLARVGEQQGPPMALSADGITRRSRRIRAARWGAGVAGSLTAAAVITLSVTLAANRQVPATPPPVTTLTTGAATVTVTPTTAGPTTTTTAGPTITTTTTTPTTTTPTSVPTMGETTEQAGAPPLG